MRSVSILKALGSQAILNMMKVVFLFCLWLPYNVANRLVKDTSGSEETLPHNTVLGQVRNDGGLDKVVGIGVEWTKEILIYSEDNDRIWNILDVEKKEMVSRTILKFQTRTAR